MIAWADLLTGLAIGIPIGWGARWLYGVRAARHYLRSSAGRHFLETVARGRLEEELRKRADLDEEEPAP